MRSSKAKSWVEVMEKNNAFEHEFFSHVFVVQKIIYFFLFWRLRHWKFWDSNNLLLWIFVVLIFCRLTIFDNRMSYWFYDHKLKEMNNDWFIPMLTYHSLLIVDWGVDYSTVILFITWKCVPCGISHTVIFLQISCEEMDGPFLRNFWS